MSVFWTLKGFVLRCLHEDQSHVLTHDVSPHPLNMPLTKRFFLPALRLLARSSSPRRCGRALFLATAIIMCQGSMGSTLAMSSMAA